MIEIIVNPTAGNGRSLEIGKEVAEKLKTLGREFILHKPEKPDDATVIAKEAAARGAETVIAIGGDGTIHKAASGLRGTKTALGIIPAGTGNDFIKSAGIPFKWEDALDFILSHPARPVDCGMVNDSFFMNECGTGFDVLALDYAAEVKHFSRGLFPYMYGVIRSILTYKAVDMHIEIDDDTVLDGKYLVCAVANGSFIGGGIPIMPGSDLCDGLLDVMVVDNLPNWRIPPLLLPLMKGTLYKKPIAHRYLAKRCVVRCNNMRLNLDGEIYPMQEAVFRVDPGALLLHW